jgi:hypothetical protein
MAKSCNSEKAGCPRTAAGDAFGEHGTTETQGGFLVEMGILF